MPVSNSAHPNTLRRALGPIALIAYGVGDILGAGIYALIGEVAARAGSLIWASFLVTLFVAALTALSYSELSSRFPRSGGEAFFTERAFSRPSLSLMIGWLVLCSGIVSIATVSRAFARYFLAGFENVPPMAENLVLICFLLILSGIAFWGIRQSSTINIVCTVVEATGLLFVIVVGSVFLLNGQAAAPATAAAPGELGELGMLAILQGSALAFFAFIGFEDMVNVAEEVKSPRRNLPLAILSALGIAGVVYILVSIIAAAVVPPAELASARGPLLEVVRRAAPEFPLWLFSIVALFAVANTGLLNLVMGSRLLYGMSNQGLVPPWLGRVHSTTRTPHLSIVTIFAAALVLAVSGTLAFLAGTTNALLLLVFFVVNLSLFVIKRKAPDEAELDDDDQGALFRIPAPVPLLGACTCLGLVFFVPRGSLWSAGVLIAIGFVLIGFRRWRMVKRSS